MLEVPKRESATAIEYIESNTRKLRSLFKSPTKTTQSLPTKGKSAAETTATIRAEASMAVPGLAATAVSPRGSSRMSTLEDRIRTEEGPAEFGSSQSLDPLELNQDILSILDDGADFTEVTQGAAT
ncbi:hypothetical protein PG997_005921 [Apiospora hydei]|uniref:Uncharacterized protein n=1 Tax=Apiospora hydei TaxID=1337664 RepID=A0ABR1WQA0_9PEZI